MRRRLGIAAGLAVLVAGGAAAFAARPGRDAEPVRAPGSAAGVWRVLGTVPATGGHIRVLAPLADDAAILVSAPDEIYGGPGSVTVDLVRQRQPHRRWMGRNKLLVDAATIEGETDLLVRDVRDRDTYDQLSLLRVGPDGTVRRVWQTAKADGPAAIARAGPRIAIAWVSGVTGRRYRPALWLATASERGAPLRTYRLAGVLPPWARRFGPTWLADLDVAMNPDGRVTLALAATSRRRQQLVLASTDDAGRVLQRQVTDEVEGLVELQTAPDGRTAALLEDTGIEGEVGECVEDGKPRVIRLAIREPASPRFRSTRVVDRPVFNCGAASAGLIAGPAGHLAVTWGVAPHWDRPAGMFVRVALAGPDRPSVRRASRWRRTRLGAALLDATGGLLIIGTRLGKGPDPLLAQRRSPGGTPQATEVIARHGGHGDVLAATSPDGRPMVAWAPNDTTLRLAIRAVP